MNFSEFHNKLEKLDYKTWLMLNLGYIEIRNKNGSTPLMWACANGNIKIVKLLIMMGADVNAKDNTGSTILTWGNSEEIVYLLMKAGAKL